MIDNSVEESNKYATEKTGSCPNFTKAEMTAYFGIYYLMGIVRLPKIDDYWSDLRYSQIADKMSRNRFKLIHRTLHFVDNNTTSDQIKLDRAWKLRPWNGLSNCNRTFRLSAAMNFSPLMKSWCPSKDAPFCGCTCQRNPRSWVSSYGVVLHLLAFFTPLTFIKGKALDYGLTETLPKEPFKIFADNFFTNFAMVAELKKRGLQYTGTIAANRLHKAPLKSEKVLMKDGRGAYNSVHELNNGLCLVRWLDNKAVTLLSTYLGSLPTTKIKRYDRSQNKRVDVGRPCVVGAYNANMGGIDLFDMMCTLYKRQIKSRWYLYIFYHSLTMVMANAWFLYRREAKSLRNNKPLQMKEFQIQAAWSTIPADSATSQEALCPAWPSA